MCRAINSLLFHSQVESVEENCSTDSNEFLHLVKIRSIFLFYAITVLNAKNLHALSEAGAHSEGAGVHPCLREFCKKILNVWAFCYSVIYW